MADLFRRVARCLDLSGRRRHHAIEMEALATYLAAGGVVTLGSPHELVTPQGIAWTAMPIVLPEGARRG